MNRHGLQWQFSVCFYPFQSVYFFFVIVKSVKLKSIPIRLVVAIVVDRLRWMSRGPFKAELLKYCVFFTVPVNISTYPQDKQQTDWSYSFQRRGCWHHFTRDSTLKSSSSFYVKNCSPRKDGMMSHWSYDMLCNPDPGGTDLRLHACSWLIADFFLDTHLPSPMHCWMWRSPPAIPPLDKNNSGWSKHGGNIGMHHWWCGYRRCSEYK